MVQLRSGRYKGEDDTENKMTANKCVERTLHPRHGCCVRTPRASGSRPLTHDVRLKGAEDA